MASVSKLCRDMDNLKKTLASIQTEFQELYSSQIANEAKLSTYLDLHKYKEKKNSQLMKCFRYLIKKQQENDIRIDTLMKILNVQIHDQKCSCGQLIPLNSSEPTKKKKKKAQVSKENDSRNNPEFQINESKGVQTVVEQNKQFTYTDDLLDAQRQTVKFNGEYCHILTAQSTFVFDASINDKFKAFSSQDDNATWMKIMNGDRSAAVFSSPLLLPDELGGLCVTLGIHGFSTEQFSVSVAALNSRDDLPIKFYVSVLLQCEGKKFRSRKHKFTVKGFAPETAHPNDFLIPIRNNFNQIVNTVIEFKFDSVIYNT